MNVLVVAPFFPPDGGVAVQRIMSLTKYLKQKNYRIIVLTQRKKTEIPHEYCDVCYQVDVNENELCGKNGYSVFKINRDKYVNKFLKILKIEHVDLIFITGGPFYTFAISEYAKKNDIPCVLDFRDPWAWDIRGKRDLCDPRRIVKRMIFRHFEKNAISAASAVVTVTPGWVKLYKQHYSAKKKHIYLVENGFDDERLKNLTIEKVEKTDFKRYTFAVFGKLFYYSDYYSSIFLKGIKLLLDEKKVEIYLKQVGEREKNANSLLQRNGLSQNLLESTGVVSYEDGMIELSKADIFIIIDSRLDALGTKLYDYIYLGKPVILVAPPNSAFASIVRTMDNGFVCDTVEKVKDAVSSIFEHYQSGKFNGNINLDNRFSRSQKNSQMEKLLKKLVNKNNT